MDRGRGFFRVESGVIDPGAVDARIMVLTVSYDRSEWGLQSLHSIFSELGFSFHTD